MDLVNAERLISFPKNLIQRIFRMQIPYLQGIRCMPRFFIRNFASRRVLRKCHIGLLSLLRSIIPCVLQTNILRLHVQAATLFIKFAFVQT